MILKSDMLIKGENLLARCWDAGPLFIMWSITREQNKECLVREELLVHKLQFFMWSSLFFFFQQGASTYCLSWVFQDFAWGVVVCFFT